MIDFTVYGEPFGKLNMRPTMIGGHASSYSPLKNKDYMSKVQFAYLEALKNTGTIDFEGQIRMEIVAYKSIPKSASNKKKLAMAVGDLRPTIKPDCDNISKVICDALNKLAFKDDSQIVELEVLKWYADIPRVEVKLINL